MIFPVVFNQWTLTTLIIRPFLKNTGRPVYRVLLISVTFSGNCVTSWTIQVWYLRLWQLCLGPTRNQILKRSSCSYMKRSIQHLRFVYILYWKMKKLLLVVMHNFICLVLLFLHFQKCSNYNTMPHLLISYELMLLSYICLLYCYLTMV